MRSETETEIMFMLSPNRYKAYLPLFFTGICSLVFLLPVDAESVAPKAADMVPVFAHWEEGEQATLGVDKTVLTPSFPEKNWWLKFNDPHLTDYMTAAMSDNPSVQVALLRVQEARTMVEQNLAKQLPTVDLKSSYFQVGLPNASSGGLKLPGTIKAFTFPLQTSYELDLWGKNRAVTQSSRKQAESSAYTAQAILNTVMGDVASAYINLLRSDGLVESQQQELKLLTRIAELKRSQNQSGLTSFEDVYRAERDVAEAQTRLTLYQQQQAIYAHQLAILIGKPPASAAHMERASLENFNLPKETEAGMPAELLIRRPDILAQERQLESAKIDISVARKAFLPTINLGSLLGFAVTGGHVGQLFNGNNYLYLNSVSGSQALFHGGGLRAQLHYSKARQKEALETYRQTILSALKDVEDSLSLLRSDYENLDSNTQRLLLTQKDLHLTEDLYQHGLTPRLNVYQAQVEGLQYQQLLIQSKADAAIATVSLYKALGGGF